MNDGWRMVIMARNVGDDDDDDDDHDDDFDDDE